MSTDDDPCRFRALLVCTVCGHVMLTGPWTTGQAAMAAYDLGRVGSPDGGRRAVREHLQVGGHDAATITFEVGSAA